jgi:hemerythrin superfamily protein
MKKKSPKKLLKKTVGKPRKKSADLRGDIIQLILADHKPLKKLIKVMKNTDKDISVRRQAFEDFMPLLILHAKPEELVLYNFMKANKALRTEAFEGDVEHGLADQMLEEARRTDDDDLWSARVKVLAELVEHHLGEEEEDIFPDFRKNSEAETRVALGEKYLMKKEEVKMDENKIHQVDRRERTEEQSIRH